MPLDMRGARGKCQTALPWAAEARVRSCECTFCGTCSRGMNHLRPNRGGELASRPRRRPQPLI